MASLTLTYRDIELEGEITHTGVSSVGVQSLRPHAGLRASKHDPFQAGHVPSLTGPRGHDWAAALLTRLYLVGCQIERQLPHFFQLLSTYRQEAAYYRALQDNVDYQDDCRDQIRILRGRCNLADHRGSRQHRVDTELCQGLLNRGLALKVFGGQFLPRLPEETLLSVVSYLESREAAESEAHNG